MPRSFDLSAVRGRLLKRGAGKDPRLLARVVLGALLAANLVAALLVFKPWGGSAEDLERQVRELRTQIQQRQAQLERSRALAAKVEKAKKEGSRFLSSYFLSRRAAYSTVVGDLNQYAKQVGMKPKEHSFSEEPIEGSEELGMLIITGSYEGTYADLVEFINRIDRSERLLIVESLQAAPQQSGGLLNVNLKLNAFLREDSPVALKTLEKAQ